ncbi:MAG: aspartate--tRNA ligase [bacterium]|nr:aspartate--tRNA ligase [bacterium]
MLRTHTCNELTEKDIGSEVILAGFVWRSRDLGGLLFIDLRDRYGHTQVVFDPSGDEELFAAADGLKSEDVVAVTGEVHPRPDGTVRDDIPTGGVELRADKLRIFSRASRLPFQIAEEETAKEQLRLKYRYLDLRRPEMQRYLEIRHTVISALREYLNGRGFLEIETPILMKSTPEGARDYIVPSRLHKGKVYALPQSPQLYKQLLMIAGFDRYYQIARCFRDEDQRGDRQPEFTQLDMEMSFAEEEDVFEIIEGSFAAAFRAALNVELELPFPRLTWNEAMSRYGIDKPDTRFGLELTDVTGLYAQSESNIFKKIAEDGGSVFAIPVDHTLSRKQIEGLEEIAKKAGLPGLAWFKVGDEGKLSGPLAKFFPNKLVKRILDELDAGPGFTVLAAGGKFARAAGVMGRVRLALAELLEIDKGDGWNLLWVTDFPLFEEEERTGEPTPSHHAFTSPRLDQLDMLETDPFEVMSRAYDVVLNGSEIGSGSVRIFDPEVQSAVMEAIGLSEKEQEKRFGFFLEALQYGVPPHAGCAPGLDRLVALMCGVDGIRDIIAFPKTTEAASPMDGCPSTADPKQFEDLGIKVIERDK